jgi:hypothetical protein
MQVVGSSESKRYLRLGKADVLRGYRGVEKLSEYRSRD